MFSSLTRRLARHGIQTRTLSHPSQPPPAAAPARELSEGEQAIHTKLTNRFTPSELLVQDVSGLLQQFAHRAISLEADVKLHGLLPDHLCLSIL